MTSDEVLHENIKREDWRKVSAVALLGLSDCLDIGSYYRKEEKRSRRVSHHVKLEQGVQDGQTVWWVRMSSEHKRI